MKILVDENIPAAAACFGQFGEVTLCNGRALDVESLRGAAVLIVRSVTQVNASLLAGSSIRFVGSCTIGTDHLDERYLRQQGIAYCNAPGANANSVVDYVLSAIASLDTLLERLLAGETLGIIGLGNVGSRLARRLSALGIRCLAYDPLLDPAQHPQLVPLSALQSCSMLCLHTPLTTGGAHPTRHLLSDDWLAALPERAALLNAGRGEVLATEALLSLAQRRPDVQMVLDCWEGEPAVNQALATHCRLATPHIAGYSADGKIAGLQQVAEKLARFLGRELAPFALPPEMAEPPLITFPSSDRVASLRYALRQIYDIRRDDQAFRASLQSADPAAGFDALRRHYPLRRELASCGLQPSDAMPLATQQQLFEAVCGRE